MSDVNVHHPPTPQWKRKLIQEKKRQKGTFIRLGSSVMADRDRKVSVTSPTSSSTIAIKSFNSAERNNDSAAPVNNSAVNLTSKGVNNMINTMLSVNSSGLPIDKNFPESNRNTQAAPSSLQFGNESGKSNIKTKEVKEYKALGSTSINHINSESKSDLQRMEKLNGNDDALVGVSNADDCDDYRPGYVNRLKAKFASSRDSTRSTTGPAVRSGVRRSASEEYLDKVNSQQMNTFVNGIIKSPDIQKNSNFKGDVAAVHAVNKFSKNIKRVNSTENLLSADKSPKDFLTPIKIIIIEQSKPSINQEAPVASSGKKMSDASEKVLRKLRQGPSKSLSEEVGKEMPLPSIVREYMKIFERSEATKRKPTDNSITQIKTKQSAPPIPLGATPSTPTTITIKPLQNSVVIVENENSQLRNNLPKNEPATEPSNTPEAETYASVNQLIKNFSIFTKAPVMKFVFPNVKAEKRNQVAEKPIGEIIPIQRERIISSSECENVVENAPTFNTSPSVPVKNSDIVEIENRGSQLKVSKQVEGNSITFKFKNDDKPPPAHLPETEWTHSVKSNLKNSKINGFDDSNSEDDHSSKSITFTGANIIVGRSAMLHIRKKKLQLCFDDKALSTHEYPSEQYLLSDESDSEDSDSAFSDVNRPINLLKPREPAPDYDEVMKKSNSNMIAVSLESFV